MEKILGERERVRESFRGARDREKESFHVTREIELLRGKRGLL